MIVDKLKDSILDNYILGNNQFNLNISSNKLLNNIKEEVALFKKNKIKLVDNKINKPHIPSNWNWVQLNDISYLITDGEHSTPERISNNKGYYLLSARNILNGYIQLDNVDYVSEQEYERISKRCNPKQGDILISCSGSIGRCAVVEDSNNYVMVRSAAMIRPCIVNSKFLMFAIQSPFVKKQIEALKKQTAQANLFLGAIASIYIPLPSIEEQKLIVNKIEKLFLMLDDIKIIEDELNLLKNKFGEEMKNSILLEAFSGNWSKSNDSNWNEFKLNSLAEIYTGNSISETIKKSKYTNLLAGYNYIGTKNLNFDHSFEYDNGVKIPYNEIGFKYADVNDILMCIEGGSAGKKIGILNEKVCFGNKLCKFSANEDIINYKFLYYYLQSPIFLRNFNDNLSGIIGGVSINKIKQLTIKIPSLEEQNRIVSKLEELLPLCTDIETLIVGE